VGGLAAFLKRHAAFIVVALVLLSPPFVTSNAYYLSVLAFMATRLMISLGLNLLMGQAGQISLGHAAFTGLGAYASAILTTRWGVNPWLAMAMAAAFAGLVAGLIGGPTLKLKGHYLAMATLGFGEITHILIVQLKGLTNGTDGIVGIPSLSVASVSFADPRYFHLLVWGVALIMFRMALNLTDSRPGRALKSLHRAEIAASSLGVNTAQQKVRIFVISAVFASIAGSFYAHYVSFISPDTFSTTFSVILVTGVVIGGLSTVWGALWGTMVMILLPEYLDNYNQDYTFLVFGVLLIVIMIFLPGGFVSARKVVSRLYARLRVAGARTGPPEDIVEDSAGSRGT
jgi:branched-chain amino acid transport system permease protein